VREREATASVSEGSSLEEATRHERRLDGGGASIDAWLSRPEVRVVTRDEWSKLL
jgi:hypothetical protein